MALTIPQPTERQPFVDVKTGIITRPWLMFLQQMIQQAGTGSAPVDAEYVVAAANATLTAERVITDTATVTWDTATAAQVKANVVPESVAVAVDVAGALDGDGTAGDPLAVRVDGVTVTINGSNQLESAPAGITELTGDVTAGPGSGSQAATIPNNTVTYAKMQNISAASRLLGRGSAAGAGDPEEITLGANLTMTGTVLAAASGADGNWIPLVDGSEPPVFITDGAGVLILVAGP